MNKINYLSPSDKLDYLQKNFQVDSKKCLCVKNNIQKNFQVSRDFYEKKLLDSTNNIYNFVVQNRNSLLPEKDYFQIQEDLKELIAIRDLSKEIRSSSIIGKLKITESEVKLFNLCKNEVSNQEIEKFLIIKKNIRSFNTLSIEVFESDLLMKKLKSEKNLSKEELYTIEKENDNLKNYLIFLSKKLSDKKGELSSILKKIEKIENYIFLIFFGFANKESEYYLSNINYDSVIVILQDILCINKYLDKNETIRKEIDCFLFELNKKVIEKKSIYLKEKNQTFYAEESRKNIEMYNQKLEYVRNEKIKWSNFSENEKVGLLKNYIDNISKLRSKNISFEPKISSSCKKWKNLLTQKFSLSEKIYTEFTILFGINKYNECELCAHICSVFGTKVEYFTKNFQGIENPLPKESGISISDLKNPDNWFISDNNGQIVFIFTQF